MTVPMPETMSPRKKVAEIVEAAILLHYPSAVISDTLDDASAILAVLASSGDHAELARLADDLRKFEHHSVGSLKISMDEVRRIIAACDAHAALLAENAALRGEREGYCPEGAELPTWEELTSYWHARATEAERRLAEAVGLLREWMGTWFVDADSRGESAIADDTRKFLSKEAERG